MSIGKRVFWSVVIFAIYSILGSVYSAFARSIEASAAVGQLDNSVVTYTLSQAMARGTLVPNLLLWLVVLSVAVLWWKPISTAFKKSGSEVAMLILALGTVMATTACTGPAHLEVFEEIGPNETAFLVPLEGDSSAQGKFMSVEYLNGAKVATKRVTIPTRQHDTGRLPGDYEWVPTMKLIKVDRTPVTRAWTKSGETGTNPSNQAFCVESKESIDFCAGGVAIATIAEDDAAKYQYNYAGKSLADVMDQDVHGYAGAIISREFGNRKLDDGRNSKADIFKAAFEETKTFFADKGVSLLQFGSSEGMNYTDPKIQAAINSTFVAENDKNTAENERVAQAKRNELDYAKAITARQVAEEFAKAKDANTALRQLDIQMVQAQAQLEFAKNLKDYKGNLPSIVPQGSLFLFGADGLRKE